MNTTATTLRAALAAAALAVIGSCATVASVERLAADTLIPATQERAMGEQYATQIEGETQLYGDPEVDAYLNDLGQRLVRTSPQSPFAFSFKAVSDPSLNAFALPGGFCYVHTGLIAAADSEAELAAVMGHEVNHVTRRHGMRNLVRMYGIEQVTAKLGGATAEGVAAVVQQTGGAITVRSFGREDEREADRYGVQAMYDAGYDPQGAVTFFEKLKAASGGARDAGLLGRILSTHPATDERIANIKAQIQTLPARSDAQKDSEEFQRIRARVRESMGWGGA
ncbi:MAG: M48 family metallopeptidase [Candidatus Sumerlaeia bacterium]|nr:M48 family metallopeptidase [Candidatus Sumerlaeia bacterium]